MAVYTADTWVILNANYTPNELPGRVVLIRHKSIADNSYPEQFTIRQITVEKVDSGLFGSYKVILSGTNGTTSIIIDNVTSAKELEIIGVV